MVGEIGEAARDQENLHARSLAGPDQICRTRIQAQSRTQHLMHVGDFHALEQCHALAQALFVVGDFATHGRFSDGRHFCLASSGICDFVHTLDVDQGRVHVESDQLELGQSQGSSKTLNGQAGGEFGRLSHGINQINGENFRLASVAFAGPATKSRPDCH